MGPSVLMISKPVAPPWNDSSKNLVKDLALSGVRFHYRVLTPKGYRLEGGRAISEPLYSETGQFSPPLLQNLRVLQRLLRPDQTSLAHFFFAPNPRSSMAARAALQLRPRRTVQTVCSTPASFAGAGRILFADQVVVLSRHTRQRFISHGIDPQRLKVIPPGIRLPPAPSADGRIQARMSFGIPRDHSVVLYPGDYQFSRAAQTFAEAIPHLADLPVTFIMACRIKQAQSKQIERRIRAMLIDRGVIERVQMHNEVSDMIELLTACDLCLLPAESTFAKMDLPLVLIEAMALGVPLVVSDRPPLSEILEDPAAGLAVPPEDPEALAAAVRELLTNPDRLGRAGEAAQRFARERFDITRVSRQYEELYADLIEG